MTAPYQPGRPLISRTPVRSRALRSVGHDGGRRVLQAEVIDGSIYDYLGVPRDEYDALMAAESKGTYYNQHIKHYDCVKVRDAEALSDER
jgi:hypothetical protein